MGTRRKIPCVIMRGGTSKGVFFHEKDLPSIPNERDAVILRAFGSPDIRQIDGLGGANSATSKMAIINISDRADADINFTFGQVSQEQAYIGKTVNCGNISSAVGPFAIDEGLIEAVEPITVVRIYNTNTKKMITAYVPVKNGKTVYKGDFVVHGVPGSGAEIRLEFINPNGAVTGSILPTGVAKQKIEVDGKDYEMSIVDSAMPMVFLKPEEFGLSGVELPEEFENRFDSNYIYSVVEKIRGIAAYMMGIVNDPKEANTISPEKPKIGFYTAPKKYIDANGCTIIPGEIDLVARQIAMEKMIHVLMGTGAISIIAAANIKGTMINEIVRSADKEKLTKLRIGHPFGIMTVTAKLGEKGINSATIGRTARRIMDGWVYV